MYGASQSNKAGKNAGKVDVYHEVKPVGGSEIYRDAIAARAYEQIFGAPPPKGVPGSYQFPGYPQAQPPTSPPTTAPRAGGGGGGTIQSPSTAPQTRVNKQGKTVPVKNITGGKGGKNKPAGGGGGTTQQAIDNAMRVAGTMEASPTVKAAQDYTTGTLRGEDQNTYRTETADMLRNVNDTEHATNYNRLLDSLWGSDTGLGGGSSTRGGGMGGRYTGYGMSSTDRAKLKAIESGQVQMPSGGVEPGPGAYAKERGAATLGEGMTGSAESIRQILASEDAPSVAGLQAKIKRQGDEALAEQQAALRLRAAGSGNYGGTGQDYAEGTAMGKYGGYLADANAQMYGDLYSQALGLGTGYDTSAQDRAAQERIAAANRESAERSAAAGAGAGARAQADAIASQERMHRLSMLGDLTGAGLDMDKFQASGFGSLGEGFSGDQRNALSLAGDTNSMGQSGWLNAGGLSLGRDQTQNQLRASLAGTGVQRQALEFDKYKYGREAPMRDLGQLGGLIGGLYDPYATTHDFGFDARSQSPSYSNPALQGLAGAAAGYSLGKDIRG